MLLGRTPTTVSGPRIPFDIDPIIASKAGQGSRGIQPIRIAQQNATYAIGRCDARNFPRKHGELGMIAGLASACDADHINGVGMVFDPMRDRP
jgi:hypothetical protein